jgi:hypothetical protein
MANEITRFGCFCGFGYSIFVRYLKSKVKFCLGDLLSNTNTKFEMFFMNKNQDHRTITFGYFENLKELVIFLKEQGKDPCLYRQFCGQLIENHGYISELVL